MQITGPLSGLGVNLDSSEAKKDLSEANWNPLKANLNPAKTNNMFEDN